MKGKDTSLKKMLLAFSLLGILVVLVRRAYQRQESDSSVDGNGEGFTQTPVPFRSEGLRLATIVVLMLTLVSLFRTNSALHDTQLNQALLEQDLQQLFLSLQPQEQPFVPLETVVTFCTDPCHGSSIADPVTGVSKLYIYGCDSTLTIPLAYNGYVIHYQVDTYRGQVSPEHRDKPDVIQNACLAEFWLTDERIPNI